jgi:hypothetical protein
MATLNFKMESLQSTKDRLMSNLAFNRKRANANRQDLDTVKEAQETISEIEEALRHINEIFALEHKRLEQDRKFKELMNAEYALLKGI